MATAFRIFAWLSIAIILVLIYLEIINYDGFIVYVLLGWLLVERIAVMVIGLMVRRVLVLQARAYLEAVSQGSGHIREEE